MESAVIVQIEGPGVADRSEAMPTRRGAIVSSATQQHTPMRRAAIAPSAMSEPKVDRIDLRTAKGGVAEGLLIHLHQLQTRALHQARRICARSAWTSR